MKVNVIKNETGKVIATFEPADPGGPSMKPVLRPGHKVHQVEASETYTQDITAFYQLHSR